MKNLIAAVTVALAPLLAPALAADGTNLAGDDEAPTMSDLDEKLDELEGKIDTLTTAVNTTVVGILSDKLGNVNSAPNCSAAHPCGILGLVDNLTTKVDAFAGRGHQVAVVMTVPIALLSDSSRVEAARVDYHLVGNSTIPGFPSSTVAADGKFARYTAALPAGTYLFELQQPYSDNVLCHGSVSRIHGVSTGAGGTSAACPRIVLFGDQGTTPTNRTRFNDGFAVYTVTTSTGHFSVRHKFPNGFTFTERSLGSYRGAVKITKLK